MVKRTQRCVGNPLTYPVSVVAVSARTIEAPAGRPRSSKVSLPRKINWLEHQAYEKDGLVSLNTNGPRGCILVLVEDAHIILQSDSSEVRYGEQQISMTANSVRLKILAAVESGYRKRL